MVACDFAERGHKQSTRMNKLAPRAKVLECRQVNRRDSQEIATSGFRFSW